MLEAVFVLTLVGVVAQLIQTWLTWYMVRELGFLDHDRSDWWEKLEDSANYKAVVRWLRFASGKK
jgi:hypothetical protein